MEYEMVISGNSAPYSGVVREIRKREITERYPEENPDDGVLAFIDFTKDNKHTTFESKRDISGIALLLERILSIDTKPNLETQSKYLGFRGLSHHDLFGLHLIVEYIDDFDAT